MDKVREVFACPGCGERRVDELVHLDDDHVQCATCGTEYNPLTREVIQAREHNAAFIITKQRNSDPEPFSI